MTQLYTRTRRSDTRRSGTRRSGTRRSGTSNPALSGVFTWRRASPLGRASPTKRAGFHLAFIWGKPSLLPRLARLAESPELTIHLFSEESRNPIFAYKFSFYNLHINKQSLWNEKISKKFCSRQPLSCVRSFDLLALVGGPTVLSAFIWKFPALLGEISVVNSEISPRRAGPPLI